jgi:hypothetical protein
MQRNAFVVSTFCYKGDTQNHDRKVEENVERWCKDGWNVVSAETVVSAWSGNDSEPVAYFATTIVVEKENS